MSETPPVAERPAAPAAPAAPSPQHGTRTATLVVLTVAVTVVLIAGVGLAGAAIGRSTRGGSPGTITVSATGTVRGTPDTVEFTIGVQTTQPTATQALDVNDARIARLEHVLADRKVPSRDLQTTGLDIWQDTNQYGVVTGFTVTDNLDVTIQGIKQAGIAIEYAVRAVGNANGIQFNGITLSISDNSSLLGKARSRAMAAARSEAQQDARASGASVGSVLRITDRQTQAITPVTLGYSDFIAAHALVPIRAGSQPVTVNVTVVYALG